MDLKEQMFRALTAEAAQAVAGILPSGHRFLVIVSDGDLANMAGNARDKIEALSLLKGAAEHVCEQDIPTDDKLRKPRD